MFFGAEITVQYALIKKHKIVPSKHAKLAFVDDREALEEKKKQVEADKKKAIELANNPEEPKDTNS